MNVYQCPSCRRRCVGESPPAACEWCHSAPPERIGAATDDFEREAYYKDLRARPEAYGSIVKLSMGMLAKRKVKA